MQFLTPRFVPYDNTTVQSFTYPLGGNLLSMPTNTGALAAVSSMVTSISATTQMGGNNSNQPMTFPIKIGQQKDKSHTLIVEGDLLLTYDTQADINTELYFGVHLPKFNQGCKERAKKFYAVRNERKKQRMLDMDENSGVSTYPLTVEDFRNQWVLQGLVQTKDRPDVTNLDYKDGVDTNDNSLYKLLAVAYSGRVLMPNLWGDIKHGQTPYLIVAKGYKTYDRDVNLRGQDVGEALAEPFVQMFPYFDPQGRMPEASDFMSLVTETVQQVVYDTDPYTHLPNFGASRAKTTPLVLTRMEAPMIISLGKVRARSGPIPGKKEIEGAIISDSGYKALYGRSQVSIDMSINPIGPYFDVPVK